MSRRVYPTCCLSAECGKSGEACNDTCPCWPDLQEFEAWRERTQAKCVDEIWSPNVYTSTREDAGKGSTCT